MHKCSIAQILHRNIHRLLHQTANVLQMDSKRTSKIFVNRLTSVIFCCVPQATDVTAECNLSPIHTSRNCADNLVATGGLPPHCPPSPWIASTLQSSSMVGNAWQQKMLPSVAVVASIVNELRVSLQLL